MFNTKTCGAVHHCTTGVVDLESDSSIHLNYIICINQGRSEKYITVLHIKLNSSTQDRKAQDQWWSQIEISIIILNICNHINFFQS